MSISFSTITSSKLIISQSLICLLHDTELMPCSSRSVEPVEEIRMMRACRLTLALIWLHLC